MPVTVVRFLLIVLVVGFCVPNSFAQKNVGRALKAASAKPVIRVAEAYHPPLRVAGTYPALSSLLQKNLLFTLDHTAQRTAAKQLLAPATEARQHALAAQRVLPVENVELDPQDRAYVAKHTAPIRQYLAVNDNTWPTYRADVASDPVLRNIRNFMEVQDPPAPVLAVQQEMIRMRAHSKARSPREIRAIVNDMLQYGIVPNRAYIGLTTEASEEELALGEDLYFAIAAYRVPMENNPWQIDGMGELADKVTTYQAMCRMTPLFEGLPKTYEADGMHKSNFPVWTHEEYAQHQRTFAEEHPFEYALAPYREKDFGNRLPYLYNTLSPVEKEAILFHTPGLPTDTDRHISADWYDEDTLRWNLAHPELEPRSFLAAEDAAKVMTLMSWASSSQYRILFNNPAGGEKIPFQELPYENQVEFLRWAWQMHRLVPQTVLNVLYK